MVGQELALIPGRYGILLCSIGPEKGHLLLLGFPVGRSIGHVYGTCGQAALSWRGCRAALVLQHSRALLEQQPSPLQGIPCPALLSSSSRVQGISCSLKVAQAKHKTQIKVLTIALTEHEKLLLKCGGFVRGF